MPVKHAGCGQYKNSPCHLLFAGVQCDEAYCDGEDRASDNIYKSNHHKHRLSVRCLGRSKYARGLGIFLHANHASLYTMVIVPESLFS